MVKGINNKLFGRRAFLKDTGMISGGLLLLASKKNLSATSFLEQKASDSGSGYNGQITGIYVVAPSVVKTGQKFYVSTKMLTNRFHVELNCYTKHYPTVSSSTSLSPRYQQREEDNGFHYQSDVPDQWQGDLKIESDQAYSGPDVFSFKDKPGPYPHDTRPICRIGPMKFVDEGIHFITFTDPITGINKTTNPIYVTSDNSESGLFWADIHGHTIFTDGVRTPEEYYYFGRDEAFLDICALSDHSEFYITDYMWDYFTAVTNGFNEPGRFVTLQGFEWTNFNTGHRNVYISGDRFPCIRSTDTKYSTLSALYKFAEEHGAIVIPHHSATKRMGCDWSLGINDKIERLLEIYSDWGSSERPLRPDDPRRINGGEKERAFLVDALEMGLKYGIMASSDMHTGRPGHSLGRNNNRLLGGLMGVWADKLDRKSVFEAMWNRRVYGTTGTRTFLKFSINGKPMGSTVKAANLAEVEVRASAEVEINRIDLVENGSDYKSVEPNKRDCKWIFKEKLTPQASYYVRITRADDEYAWSSPIWVEI